MIENPYSRSDELPPELQFTGESPVIRTSKVDWGTRVAYDITIRTYDPSVVALATLKADSKVLITVRPQNGAKRANTRKEYK